MNFKNYDLDNIVILTTRSQTSLVKVFLPYETIKIEASLTCPRSEESELKAQCEILETLGFSDEQIRELNYE